MELKCIKANGHKVIASGSIIGYEELPVFTFELQEENRFSFTLTLIFEDNNKEMSATSDVNQNDITIHCANFKNSLGSGFTKPIELATVGGKKIFFKFVAHNMKELPVLEYCFYEE